MNEPVVAGILLSGLLPVGPALTQAADSEEKFRQMVAVLNANNAERQEAACACIAQGIGDNPSGGGVPSSAVPISERLAIHAADLGRVFSAHCVTTAASERRQQLWSASSDPSASRRSSDAE